MITTVTTVTTVTTTTTTTTTLSTTTTTMASGYLGASIGVIAIVTLIVLLSTKELLNATEDYEYSIESATPWSLRAKLFNEKLTIPIYSLFFVFVAILVTEIITILE